MPTKKKRYNSRFPPARIKKIMQSDEEVGKVAAAVPVIISRALELFVETLLKKVNDVTVDRGARTLTPSHIKSCIHSEARFHFLKELVQTVPDLLGERDDSLPPTVSLDSKVGPQRRVVRSSRKFKARPNEEEEENTESEEEDEEDSSEPFSAIPSVSSVVPFTLTIPPEENGNNIHPIFSQGCTSSSAALNAPSTSSANDRIINGKNILSSTSNAD